MEKKDIRVLALDLDGTLTNDEKIVTPRTRAALDAAAAQGVTIARIRTSCASSPSTPMTTMNRNSTNHASSMSLK